jgi:hypothetical protein
VLIGEAVADVAIEVSSLGIGPKKFLVTSGGDLKIAIQFTTSKLHVEQVSARIKRDRS